MEAVNGMMLFSFLFALALTVPVSFFFVWLFKKRVEGMINSENDFTFEPSDITLRRHRLPFPGLTRVIPNAFQSKSSLAPKTSTLLVYFIPALIVGFVLQSTVFKLDMSLVMMLLLFLWSIVPLLFILRVISVPGGRLFRRVLLGYLGAVLVIMLYFLARNTMSKVAALAPVMGLYLVATTLVFFLLHSIKAIKTIAPFVFPVVFLGSFLVNVAGTLLVSDEKLLKSVFNSLYTILDRVGLADSTTQGVRLIVLFLFLIFVGGSLILLRSAYKSKNINGQMLIIDCFWISHIYFLMALSYKDLRALTYPAALFCLYKIIQWVIMKLLKIDQSESARRLLVLRVFSLGKRSERLFGTVSSYWLNHGFIKLIAGYDLTNSLVDIDDLLTFISGRIRRRFCLSEALIAENLSKMDVKADVDGRYRVNEMYCNNSTWQAVLDQLLPHSDRVLMDLRSFKIKNAGCAHEIRQLVYSVPLEKVVFVTDEEGIVDESDLYKVAEEAWANLPADSPNYNNPDAKFNMYVLSGTSDVPALLSVL